MAAIAGISASLAARIAIDIGHASLSEHRNTFITCRWRALIRGRWTPVSQRGSSRPRATRISRAVAQQALFFAVPIALLLGFALVVLLLSTREADLQLDAALVEMQVERRKRIPRTLYLADEAIDLDLVHQQLARASRLRPDVRRRSGKWRDVRPEEHDLAVLDDDISLLE